MHAKEIAAAAAVAAAVTALGVYLTHGGHTESLRDQRFIAITDQNPALAPMQIKTRIALGHKYCVDPASVHGFDASVLHTLRIAATTAYCP